MRNLRFLGMILILTPLLWGADWKPLPSTPVYQSQLDLDSIGAYGVFVMNRAYVRPQSLPSGKTFTTVQSQYYTICSRGEVSLGMALYIGDNKKLTHIDFQRDWKSKFSAPKEGSDLAEAMKQACVRLSGNGGVRALPDKPTVRTATTGSGIIVNRNGLILTNDHVVRQCNAYQVILDTKRILKASLKASDSVKDLALLAVEESFPLAAPIRKDAAPRLGETVMVVGYPLVNVLGSRPNVSFGNINSTVGPQGNAVQMQIDVPIQRGNSGGPVFDAAGNVIGIVVAKLDALKLAQRTGDLPQNINFAIRGDVMRSFLETHQVDLTDSSASNKLENTEMAKRGTAVTVLIRCIREPSQTAPAVSSSGSK